MSGSGKDAKRDKRVAESMVMMKRLIGDRSYKEVSRVTGMSVSTISYLARGVTFPQPETIEKLTDPKCNPQGGVTKEKYMEAVGYINKNISLKKFMKYVTYSLGGAYLANPVLSGVLLGSMTYDYLDGLQNDKKAHELADRLGVDELQERIEQIDITFKAKLKAVKSLILLEAMNHSNISLHGFVETKDDILVPADFGVKLSMTNRNISEWLFILVTKEIVMDDCDPALVLRQLLSLETDSSKKVSIILENKLLYQKLLSRKGKIPYRGELSIILYENDTLTSEEYISYYSENDDAQKFILF